MTYVDERGVQDYPLGADIRFADTQDIQVLQDKCLQACHFLESDEIILQRLGSSLESPTFENGSHPSQSQPIIWNLLTDIRLARKRVENLARRLDATIALVRKAIKI